MWSRWRGVFLWLLVLLLACLLAMRRVTPDKASDEDLLSLAPPRRSHPHHVCPGCCVIVPRVEESGRGSSIDLIFWTSWANKEEEVICPLPLPAPP